jgi:hypothetical protein
MFEGPERCRPLAFRLLDATLRWRVDAQETIAAFADELDPTDDARRLRTAIDPRTTLLAQLLRDADSLLVKARAVIADAAGPVLCDDRAHARATATLLRTITAETPVGVVSDEPQAHTVIDFAADQRRHMARGTDADARAADRRPSAARGPPARPRRAVSVRADPRGTGAVPGGSPRGRDRPPDRRGLHPSASRGCVGGRGGAADGRDGALVNRGEVWWVEHPDAGRRPACVLSRQARYPS